ncbi:MAG: hypothetical protein JXQ71_07400 [Verrucomicrobia bacterium]|nr:hypothetical protein [Verrucomicrobiota bacterium]
MLNVLLRSRAFALAIHALLWLLLAACLMNLGTAPPPFVESGSGAMPVDSPAPIARITHLLARGAGTGAVADTNLENPFATRYFIPPVVPPPPPPTTRQVQVTYHGYYQTGEAPARAFLTVDQKTVTGPVGSFAIKPWIIAGISPAEVTLTNSPTDGKAAAQTHRIPFNKTASLEVPVP